MKRALPSLLAGSALTALIPLASYANPIVISTPEQNNLTTTGTQEVIVVDGGSIPQIDATESSIADAQGGSISTLNLSDSSRATIQGNADVATVNNAADLTVQGGKVYNLNANNGSSTVIDSVKAGQVNASNANVIVNDIQAYIDGGTPPGMYLSAGSSLSFNGGQLEQLTVTDASTAHIAALTESQLDVSVTDTGSVNIYGTNFQTTYPNAPDMSLVNVQGNWADTSAFSVDIATNGTNPDQIVLQQLQPASCDEFYVKSVQTGMNNKMSIALTETPALTGQRVTMTLDATSWAQAELDQALTMANAAKDNGWPVAVRDINGQCAAGVLGSFTIVGWVLP